MTSQQCYFITTLIVNILCLVNGRHKFAEEVAPIRLDRIHCNFTDEHKKLVQNVTCNPREILVKLIAEPGYIYNPDVVPLKRCQGYCMNDVPCMATEKILTSVIVQQQHISADMFSCVKIHVEEHTKCSCLCDVKRCNPKQTYSQDDCACVCTNTGEKELCDQMPERIWDPESCTCTCDSPNEECSTDFEWVPSMCKCVQVNNGDYYLDNYFE